MNKCNERINIHYIYFTYVRVHLYNESDIIYYFYLSGLLPEIYLVLFNKDSF